MSENNVIKLSDFKARRRKGMTYVCTFPEDYIGLDGINIGWIKGHVVIAHPERTPRVFHKETNTWEEILSY